MIASQKYWFYLEPNVFLFHSNEDVLLYDYLTKQTLEFQNNKTIKHIVDILSDPLNLYTIPIGYNELNNPIIKNFIDKTCESFMGNIVHQETTNIKPVIIPPIQKIHIDKKEIKDSSSFLDTLNQLCIYINGSCAVNCPNCDGYHKQIYHCKKNEGKLSIADMTSILKQLENSSCHTLQITGGNVFLYNNLAELISLLNGTRKQIDFGFHYLNYDTDNLLELPKSNNWKYTVYISPPYNIEQLILITKTLSTYNLDLQFTVTKDAEVEEVQNFIDTIEPDTIRYSILPFYNGVNILFFKQNVFIDKIDLYEDLPDKNDIFARQLFNTNDFGRLTVFSNGEIYANCNFKSIGNINQGFSEVISGEYANGKSWFRIRDKQPCNTCVHQWLCPSPSNYEFVLGRSNLCNIK